MKKVVNPDKYDSILHDEGFINDLWNTLDATSKVSLLLEMGFDVEKEYDKHVLELEAHFKSAFLEDTSDQAREDDEIREHNTFVERSESWLHKDDPLR